MASSLTSVFVLVLTFKAVAPGTVFRAEASKVRVGEIRLQQGASHSAGSVHFELEGLGFIIKGFLPLACRTAHQGNGQFFPPTAGTVRGWQCGFKPRPLIRKPPPLNRDYNRDPNIEALKRRGLFIMGLH